MRRTRAATALALGIMLAVPGSAPARWSVLAVATGAESQVDLPIPPEPAKVSDAPVVVDGAALPATQGWSAIAAAGRVADVGLELLSAYSFAVAVAPRACHLPLSLLAAIGEIESGNSAGHRIDASHRVVPSIIGPVLDGTSTAAVPDTDGGLLDGDRTWDHAVGPFQFIPSSWRVAGVDFDDDGVRDPQDVYDAAGAAMVYLCAGDRDLDDPQRLRAAVLAYGVEAWPWNRTLTSVLAYAVVIGGILVTRAAQDVIGWCETAEIPLMATLVLIVVHNVRTARLAHARLARIAWRERLRARPRERISRMTSHEMRTPATIAIGYVEMLIARERDRQQREDLEVVRNELTRLALVGSRLIRTTVGRARAARSC